MDKDQERVEDRVTPWGKGMGGSSGMPPDGEDAAGGEDLLGDEVIDLVDVVREGEAPARAGKEDLSLILEQAQEEEEEKEEFEAPDFDFEAPEATEPARGQVLDISDEDLARVMADLERGDLEPGLEEAPAEPVAKEEPPAVSQEKLEAALISAVTPVVERVVREAVAEAAERVIQEAIEGLRKSLETTPT